MVSPYLVRQMGHELLRQDGSAIPLGDITGTFKVIGLYFASSWDPECRKITDQLASLATSLNAGEPAERGSEEVEKEGRGEKGGMILGVVLVSNNEDETSFRRTFESLPSEWRALPFENSRIRMRLARQHRISQVPSLVLINGCTGRLICRNGREMLSRDPKGVGFPWKTPLLKDILNHAPLVDSTAESASLAQLKNCYKGLYFSANWCPPCKAFTPQLISTYHKIKAKGKKFEIIFISSDRSEESFTSYHRQMPWPAVPFAKTEIRRLLKEMLQVQGIPCLVILDEEYNVVSNCGRNLVNADAEGEKFPWRFQSVEVLSETHLSIMFESPAVVLFTDGDPNKIQMARDVLMPAAEEYYSEHFEDSGLNLVFFVAGKDAMSEQVRDVCGLGEEVTPLLALLDLKGGTKALLSEEVPIDATAVHSFITRYETDSLTFMPLSEDEEDKEAEETTDEETMNEESGDK